MPSNPDQVDLILPHNIPKTNLRSRMQACRWSDPPIQNKNTSTYRWMCFSLRDYFVILGMSNCFCCTG